MQIIAHRGMWDDKVRPNSLQAFSLALANGFGVETDVRDFHEELLISHDIPCGNEPNLIEFLNIFNNTKLPLAINIKADGLGLKLCNIFKNFNIHQWFVFDMSIPDTIEHLKIGNPIFMRQSEYEPPTLLHNFCDGCWLDSFNDIWYDLSIIENLLNTYHLCIVSNELHGRDPTEQWSILKNVTNSDNFILCTDRPIYARKYFGVLK